jgi:uncharacterized protein YegL
MVRLREFSVSPARPLPVILLLDVSGSMSSDNKIGVLNHAVAEMVRSLVQEDNPTVEIYVSIITFGGESACIHQPLQPISQVVLPPLEAAGKTPMGSAFDLACGILEDHQQVPSLTASFVRGTIVSRSWHRGHLPKSASYKTPNFSRVPLFSL